jgi:hypothetical protein
MASITSAPVKTGPTTTPAKGAAAAPKSPTIPSNSPLLQPSQTLSGQPLAQAAGQIANAQTAGPISELAKQIATQDKQGAAAAKDTFGYYLQLAKDAQSGVNQIQGINSGLSTQLQGINQSTQQQLGQIGTQAQGGALGRLTSMGLGGDQTANLQGETARLQGLGTVNSGAFQAAGANQGANYKSNAVGNLGVDALAGTQAVGQIGQATRLANEPLNAKIAALDASKGALAANALGSLRTAERNYQVAQQGLGIKKATVANQTAIANNTIAYDAAKIKQAAATLKLTGTLDAAKVSQLASATGLSNARTTQALAAAGLSKARANALGTGTTVTKPLTTAQQNKAYVEIGTIHGLINQARAQGKGRSAIEAVLSGRGYDAWAVAAALDVSYNNGQILPGTAALLRAAGLRGNRLQVDRGDSALGQVPGVGAIPGVGG